MPDMFTVGLLSIGGSLLGSLNRAKPKDDFEAVKIIDENDPIRRSLEMFQDSVPPGVELHMNDGTCITLTKVREIGYGAALLDIEWRHEEHANPEKPWGNHSAHLHISQKRGVATIRYSAVATIRQIVP